MATNKTKRKPKPAGASRKRAPRKARAPTAESGVSALVVLVANKLTSGASTAYRGAFGIGTVESRMLVQVAAERWISPQRISRLGGIDKGGVSRSMKLLLDRGLLVARDSPTDARSVELALTAKGQAVHDRIARVAAERERRLLAGLSKTRVRSLVITLQRLDERVAEMNEAASRS